MTTAWLDPQNPTCRAQVRALLRGSASARELSDDELLAIAALLSSSSLSMILPGQAAGLLFRLGLPRTIEPEALASRLVRAARRAPGFRVIEDIVIVEDPEHVRNRALALLRRVGDRESVQKPRVLRSSAGAERHGSAQPKSSAAPQRVAPGPSAAGPAGARRANATLGRVSIDRTLGRAAHSAHARRNGTAQPTSQTVQDHKPQPKGQTTPAPALVMEIPPAPEAALAPPTVAAIDVHELAALLAQAKTDLARVSVAVRAHLLAGAEQFQEVLSLSSMTGVVSHTYQLETVRRVMRALRGRALLADEVGLGKTIEALLILREYQLRGMVRRALVLAPPALVRQWTGELLQKAGIEARTTEDMQLREAPERFWGAEGVVVASIAMARSAKHAPLVSSVSWDLVIVDEAHHVKNRQTLAWKLVNELRSRFLLLLTATPVETDLEEIYNLVTLLRPGQLTTPAAFRAQFVDPKDPTSPRNHEQLRRLLSEVMVRNTRAQCGLRLPPRFVTTVVVEPSVPEQVLYDQVVALLQAHGSDRNLRLLVSTLMLEAGSSARAVRATLERAAEKEKGDGKLRGLLAPVLETARREVTASKAARLVEIVRSHKDPVLVFTRYRETLAYVADTLEDAGIAMVSFHGGLSAAAKREAVSRFQSGLARVMIASEVGAEGQNLHFCHVLVNYDLPWNPMVLEQRIGRLHRMGQSQEVLAFNLCARGTVEERILDVLDRRLHLFELVVGEMDMVLGNLADERDLEERILHLYASSQSTEDIDRGFDAIAEELAQARTRYERTRTLDEKLFRRDFET